MSDLLSIEISTEPEHVVLVLRQSDSLYRVEATRDLLPEWGTRRRTRICQTPVAPTFTHPLWTRSSAAGRRLPHSVTPDDVPPTLVKQYQSLVGALLFCTILRREHTPRCRLCRTYAVSMLCRSMSKPTAMLLDAAYRVLYYLHHHKTKTIGL